MKTFKKILVPTDFSESAIAAYTHAQEIAKKYGAKIDFIHVIPTLKYFNESMANLGVPLDMDTEELYPTIQKETIHRLKEIMDDYISDACKGEAIAKVDRKASHAITEVARSEGHDLIVMATRGQHNSELLRGTTTEKVIRHSDIPVFTVNKRLSTDGLKRILLPTDGSSISFSAIPIALSIADVYDSEITLFHVSELYGADIGESEKNPMATDEENRYEAIIDRLEDYLADSDLDNIQLLRGEVNFEDQFVITENASSRTINFYTVIEKDVSAHHGIEEYAADNADAVVMATHGRSGLAHFFLGSTTEQVARHLDLPVVTVKPEKDVLKERKK